MSGHHDQRTPLTVEETAQRLGVTAYVVRKAIKARLIDGFTLGSVVRVLPGSVDRLLGKEQTEEILAQGNPKLGDSQ